MKNYTFDPSLNCKEGEIEDVWCVSFGDIMSQLGAGIIIQPVVSFLEHIALAKSFAKREPQERFLLLTFDVIRSGFNAD